MPRTKLGYYVVSPLARHPALLLRKIRDRVAGSPRFTFEDPPASVQPRYPEKLAAALRTWAMACELNNQTFPSARVFHHDFDRGELLQLCRTGPLPRNDLRGDVKLIWEFSRGYAYPLNAVRGLVEADSAATEIREWIEHNADPDGPNWTNPMEIAIRAVNWICADALMDGAVSETLGRDLWTSNLWNSGRAIFQRLEARLICSNHYLADVLGLLFIGTVLGQDSWHDFATREFPRALEVQTFDDGGVYEASLPYHALVTEMALLFAMLSGRRPSRLPSMCQVLADLTGTGGDVFQVGDSDGGRIVPLDFVSDRLGRADILLKLSEIVMDVSTARRNYAIYPESGWWIAREGDWTAMLELGGVGLAGAGSHAHNDTLSLCVLWKGEDVLVDPGSYLYTPDPAARNRMRSTAAHSTIMINGAEQLPLPQSTPHDLFSLPGPADTALVSGLQKGAITAQYESLRRKVQVVSNGVKIVDEITRTAAQEVTWFFHFHPSSQLLATGTTLEIKLKSGAALALRAEIPGARLEIVTAEYSPFYGSVQPSRCARFRVETPVPGMAEFVLEAG